MNIKKYVSTGLVLASFASFAVALPAFADTKEFTQGGMMRFSNDDNRGEKGERENERGMMRPYVSGTVLSINGNTITISGKPLTKSDDDQDKTKTSVTYTVDATNAVVIKNKTISKVSDILVGDTVKIQGTVNGTNITAVSIRDGVMMSEKGAENRGKEKMASSTPIIVGNGQPIVGGIISAISSSTITITNKSNVVYTVNTSNAKIVQGKNTILLSNLAVGDSVIVQGTVNGTAITASSIIDQNKPAKTESDENKDMRKGFFGGMGQFFARLFGF